MTLPADLARDLEDALRSFGAARRSASMPFAPGKALELWLTMQIATYAQSLPEWEVGLYNGLGHRLDPGQAFVVRSQPGPISAPHYEAPGYVRVARPERFGGGAFEMHGSLQYEGRSGARHECDISMITSRIGSRIREDRGGRPSGIPIAAVECKHHLANGSIGEAREKIARLFDLAHLAQSGGRAEHKLFWSGPAACGWGNRASTYRATFRKGLFAIARSSGFQAGAVELAEYYGVRRYQDVYARGRAFALSYDVVNCLRKA